MGLNFGGFLGIGNSSAKTDRGNQLAGINGAWSVFNRGLPIADTALGVGQSTVGKGITSLDQAKQYWQKLMGNRTQQMQAVEPVTSAVNEQADAARKQQAEMGTDRGGGVAAANQGAESDRMKQVSDTIAQLQPAAAKGLETTGTAEANAGEAEMRDAFMALGLSQDAANEIINSSITSRPISMKANAEVRQQWSNFLAALGL